MTATSYGLPLAEKRVQLIHPPKSNFLKMEAAALIYLKTAIEQALYYIAAKTTVL